MLSQAGQVMVQQVDNMMVGRVGTTELAAAALANSVFITGMVAAMGFTFGITPLIGHAFAKGNHKKVSSLLKNSMLTNLLINIFIFGVLLIVSFYMHRMGQPEHVVALAIPYYHILLVSLIPFIIFFTIKQFAEGIGNTTIAMYVTISANIVNLILNYILIFGKFGSPAFGLNGAGYATLVARVWMPIMFIILIYKKDSIARYFQSFKEVRINKKEIKEIFHVGYPISLQILLEVSAFAFSAVMMGWLGETPMAAHHIALGLASMTFMVVTGIASATTIRVAHQYSKNNIHEMYKATMASLHLVLMFMSVGAVCFILFKDSLPFLYTNDEDVALLASQLLIMAAIFQIFDGTQVTILGALRGLADVKKSMLYAFIAYIVINVPLSYFLTFTLHFGPRGIWIGFVAGLGIAAILFYKRFHSIYLKIKP